MKPTLEQVREFMERDVEEALPPSPYQIALTLGASLLASGRFADDPAAAVQTGWLLVMPFYQGVAAYKANATMLFDISKHASMPEGDMSAAEARAYVTGGETGDSGEAGGQAVDLATLIVRPQLTVADLETVQARQRRIADTTQKVQAARAALDTALGSKAKGRAARIAKAQKEFDEAAAEQSAAYV